MQQVSLPQDGKRTPPFPLPIKRRYIAQGFGSVICGVVSNVRINEADERRWQSARDQVQNLGE